MTRHPAARLITPPTRVCCSGTSIHQREPQATTGLADAVGVAGNHGSVRHRMTVQLSKAGPLARSLLALAVVSLLASGAGVPGLAVSGAHAAQLTAAMASLPPSAGRVMSVQESGGGSEFRQRIILSGGLAGANMIEIAGGRGAAAPTASQIGAELAAQFPGIDMTPLPERVLRNAYGPMHIAIGAPATGGRCIYAWQKVADLPRAPGQGMRLFQRSNPGSVRIRLCSANATLDQLAEMSEHLVITAPVLQGSEPGNAGAGESGAASSMRGFVATSRGTGMRDLAGQGATVQGAAYRPRDYAESRHDPDLYDAPMQDVAPQPRIVLAQASRRGRSGAMLDRSAGNPGGLIGMLRGYRRSDPISVSRPSRGSRTQRQSGAGFGQRPLLDDSPGGGFRGGLLGRLSDRNRSGDQRQGQPAPRRKPRPAAAPQQRRVAPKAARPQQARPEQARPEQERLQQARPQPVDRQPRQVQPQVAVPGPTPQRSLPQGYQAPGGGARYLGQAPGTSPVGSSAAPSSGGNASVPQVPRPVQPGPGSVAPGAGTPGVRAPAGAGQPQQGRSQPGSMGTQPVLRGLDPAVPGRAYRGPAG